MTLALEVTVIDILSENGHCWSGIPTGGSGLVVNLSSPELLVVMDSITLFSVKVMYNVREIQYVPLYLGTMLQKLSKCEVKA